MYKTDQDKQKDFLDLMRSKYVVSNNYIMSLFKIRKVAKFVQDIRDRTGLDIYEGKQFSYEDDADETVYFMISDINPACPGLDNMEDPLGLNETHVAISEAEYQNGYYLMWDCPAEDCGQFHKVDLGDEQLVSPRNVRCIKCGKQYQVRPLSWR